MFNTIRKNHQFLMLLIVVLTIVGFAAMYIRANPTQFGTNDVALVYGRVVQRAEIDKSARCYQLALNLSLTDFLRDLGGLASNEEASLNEFIINLLVVQHLAPELGIRPSDEAVLEEIKTLAPFQTEGAFDPAKYAAFVQERLGPLGLTERNLEDVVRDSLRVKALHRVVTSTVAVGEGEVREAARIYQPITAQVLRFDREKFLKDVTISTEEIAAFYTKNQAMLKAGETRSLAYVTFELPAAQQKLTGKERTTALQKLADDAVAAGKTIREDLAKGVEFAKSAEKAALHPRKSPSVSRDGLQEGKDSGLPVSVVGGAFRLQKSGEISDIIQDGNAFYIVTVEGISPPRQLELSEVSGKIATLLKGEKAANLMAEAARKSLQQIQASLTAGKSFADAVKQAGVKTEQLKDLLPSDARNTQEQQAFVSSSLGLKEGAFGKLQPAPWGAFALYLEKRTPLTDAQWAEHQKELTRHLLDNDQELLFQEWLQQSRAAAQIKPLGRRAGGA